MADDAAGSKRTWPTFIYTPTCSFSSTVRPSSGRPDLDRGRVRPSWSLDASAGASLFDRRGRVLRLQVDVFNLTDRFNVINFAGLLSGTAVAPRRTVAMRLHAGF